jgi:hypothetical protein
MDVQNTLRGVTAELAKEQAVRKELEEGIKEMAGHMERQDTAAR